MTEDSNGAPPGAVGTRPNYAEMAERLYEIGAELFLEGKAKNADDLIEKAQRLLCIASQIRCEQQP